MDPHAISGELPHEALLEYQRHRRRVGEVKSAVDASPPRVKANNGKREMMLKESKDRIHGENLKLVQRILNAKTSEISLDEQLKSHNKHREKLRVMINNLRSQRLYRLEKIAQENLQIRTTLLHQRPVESVAEWDKHAKEISRMRRNLSVFANREWRKEQKQNAHIRRAQAKSPPKHERTKNKNASRRLGVSLSALTPPPKMHDLKPLAPTLASLAHSTNATGSLNRKHKKGNESRDRHQHDQSRGDPQQGEGWMSVKTG
jgi:hypothetical protein